MRIRISKRAAKRVRHGHLWVYRTDVLDAAEAEAGAIADVVDEAANFVGQAFYSDASEIALRFLTNGKERIDRDWWRLRLHGCATRRAPIRQETNAYRLVYSEGDLLPSIIVDVYDGHYVLQTLSQGSDRMQNELAGLLVEEFQPKSILELNNARVRKLERLELRSGAVHGDPPAEIEVEQNGVRFVVAPATGQKTGAFLDQRENYSAAQKVAHGRALDCFTFNGGFALHLASASAGDWGIDIAANAVAAAQRNAAVNEIKNATFTEANVFDALREMESAGERFDTIVLDP